MTERRGMVLVAVVGVLSLMALVAASLVSTSIRLRQGAGSTAVDVALDMQVDAVLEQILAGWRDAGHGSLAQGATVSVPVATRSGISATATVTRLGPSLHLVVATVTTSSGARRRASLAVRGPVIDAGELSAVVSFTSVVVGANVTVGQGSDSLACPVPMAPAILVSPGSYVQPDGAVAWRTSERAGLPVTHLAIGGISVERLSRMADTVIEDGGTLVVGAGPPRVVSASGDLSVTSGEGDLVLVVRGRLRLGDARIRGVVVAGGGVETAADGGEITGLLIAGRREDGTAADPSRLLHRASFRFAPCIAQDVAARAVRPWPIRGRAWAELH